MTDYTKIYIENLNNIKRELFSTDREASAEVRRLLEEHYYPYEYSRQQLNTWIGGNVKTLPSVAAAPYIARALKTNLGSCSRNSHNHSITNQTCNIHV